MTTMKQNQQLPIHQNPSSRRQNLTRVANAPYNFVPLPDLVIPAVGSASDLPNHDAFLIGSSHHSGYIDVRLTTLSLLYIRCGLTKKLFDLNSENKDKNGRKQDETTKFRDRIKNTPEFFYTQNSDQPVIPGSSLRGMIRSLIEIITCSKTTQVSNKQLFFRTVDDTAIGTYYRSRMTNNVECGFLLRDQNRWVIQKCEMLRVPRELLNEGNGLYKGNGPNKTPQWTGQPHQHQPCWVIATDSKYEASDILWNKPDTGAYHEGRLIITGDMQGKLKEFAFLLPHPQAEKIEVSEKIIRTFEDSDQVTQWQQRAFPKDAPKPNSRRYDGALPNDLGTIGEPIFFLRENGALTFIGRARNFRLPYQNTPLDLVPDWAKDPNVVDIADALFGFVRKTNWANDNQAKLSPEYPAPQKPKQGDKEMAYAGRVSFTDAVLEGDYTEAQLWMTGDARQAVTPKLLSTPKPTCFQHYLTQQDPNNQRQLDHYDSPGPHETTLRGHKLYWRRGKVGEEQIKPDQFAPDMNQGEPKATTKLYTQFKPLAPGVQFKFRLYFDNLTDVEMGALMWALTIPVQGNYCHALGMAKPLGLGSVRLSATLHKVERGNRYESCFVDDGSNWHGLPTAQIDTFVKTLCQKFEAEMCKNIQGQSGAPATLFSNITRIKMLLKLMTWRETIDSNLTNPIRQMSAVQGGNEFRSRPVLPDPLNLGGIDQVVQPPRPITQSANKPQLKQEDSPLPKAMPPVPPAQPPRIEIPQIRAEVDPDAQAFVESLNRPSVTGIEEGAIYEGTVLNITAKEYLIDIGFGERVPGRLPRDEIKNLAKGDSVKVKVKKYPTTTGAAIVTVKGIKS